MPILSQIFEYLNVAIIGILLGFGISLGSELTSFALECIV